MGAFAQQERSFHTLLRDEDPELVDQFIEYLEATVEGPVGFSVQKIRTHLEDTLSWGTPAIRAYFLEFQGHVNALGFSELMRRVRYEEELDTHENESTSDYVEWDPRKEEDLYGLFSSDSNEEDV